MQCEPGPLYGQSSWWTMERVQLITLGLSGPRCLPGRKVKCSSWSNNGQTGPPGNLLLLLNAGSPRGELVINLAFHSTRWAGEKVSLRGWSPSTLCLDFLTKRTGFKNYDICSSLPSELRINQVQWLQNLELCSMSFSLETRTGPDFQCPFTSLPIQMQQGTGPQTETPHSVQSPSRFKNPRRLPQLVIQSLLAYH